jgi:hypothetical protein
MIKLIQKLNLTFELLQQYPYHVVLQLLLEYFPLTKDPHCWRMKVVLPFTISKFIVYELYPTQ